MESADVLSTLFVFLIGTAGVFAVERLFTQRERNVLWIGYAGHVLSALAMVWVTVDVLGGGDMMGYHVFGSRLADAMRLDFWNVAPDVLRVTFHQDVPLPVPIHGVGSASGTMYCLSAFVFLVVGDSLYGACMVMGIASYFARVLIYRALRDNVDAEHWNAVAIASFLVPSVSFWCSGLLKETFAFCGLAAVFWGANALMKRRAPVVPGLMLASGVLLIGIVKPYILMPAGIASGGWVYFTVTRRQRLHTVWALPVALAVGIVAVLAVGELFPRYSFMNLPEETAHIQGMYQLRTSGDSKISLVEDPSTVADRGFAGQLAYAPLAILTALFRPSLLDVRNAQMLVNSVEVSVFTVLFLTVVVRKRVRDLFAALYARPVLAFCLLFVIVMSLGVGLATANLGSLSRYRTPMMPFYAAALALGLRRRDSAMAPVPEFGGTPARRAGDLALPTLRANGAWRR
jgi:hypothetical protein